MMILVFEANSENQNTIWLVARLPQRIKSKFFTEFFSSPLEKISEKILGFEANTAKMAFFPRFSSLCSAKH